jgi:hypothetical protein
MIRGWIEDLLTLTEDDWFHYAFNCDPFVGRITRPSQSEYCQKAADSAVALAYHLRGEYGDNTIDYYAKQMGVSLLYKSEESSSGYTMFACYKEPNTITVFLDNAEATDKLLAENKLQELVGTVKTADLLAAHELYHYLEQTIPDIYTAQKHITLWKLGPIENLSRIICLEEIGAMAFAKELTGLKCSPYVFNVIMLYPRNPQRAKKLYETFMGFGSGRSERLC